MQSNNEYHQLPVVDLGALVEAGFFVPFLLEDLGSIEQKREI
jgi:hypothetical protein